MRRHHPAQQHVVPARPAWTKREMLEDKLRGLKAMVASRHRAARQQNATADVADLSATIRAVKAEIAKLPSKKAA